MKITQDLADAIAKAIANSNTSVLNQRHIADANGDLAREFARNAAQDVVALIEDGASWTHHKGDLMRCLKCGALNDTQDMVWCAACVNATLSAPIETGDRHG